jgi:hypothetical protein
MSAIGTFESKLSGQKPDLQEQGDRLLYRRSSSLIMNHALAKV